MKFIFLLCLTVSQLSFAGKVLRGEGRFFSQDQDKLKFVKDQLLYSAVSDLVTKELNIMGLDSNLFWQKYQEKFDHYFAPIKNNLKKKYKIDVEGETPTERERNLYEEVLRKKKLSLKRKYGKLHRILSSYSIKRMTRSPHMPNSRYMLIKARVNRKNLTSIYRSFVNEKINKTYSILYIYPEYKLTKMAWGDTGVEIQEDFTSVIHDHWTNVLAKKFGNNVKEVKFIKDNTELENQLSLNSLSSPQSRATEPLYLKISFNIEMMSSNNLLMKKSFKVSGSYLFYNLHTGALVDFYEIPAVVHEVNYKDAHELSSSLASLIYRRPLASFNGMIKKLAKSSVARSEKYEIEVENVSNVKEIFGLSQFLEERGVVKQLKSQLKILKLDRAIMSIDYLGQKEELTSFLKSLNNSKFLENRVLTMNESAGGFSLKIEKTIEKTDSKK